MLFAILSILIIFSHGRDGSLRCALDGSLIQPIYEVVIVQEDGVKQRFSCVLSARIWLKRDSAPVSCIWVTDEVTGEKVNASEAVYVKSDVVTKPHVGNRIHVFAQRAAAHSHARLFDGALVPNPLEVPRPKVFSMIAYKRGNDSGPDLYFSPNQKHLCLAHRTISTRAERVNWLSKRQPYRLMKGYGNPPEKPPKCVL
jgi:hypothetical protein